MAGSNDGNSRDGVQNWLISPIWRAVGSVNQRVTLFWSRRRTS
jgi:hypothetical protein